MRYQTAPCPAADVTRPGYPDRWARRTGRESYPRVTTNGQFNRPGISAPPPARHAARLVLENHAGRGQRLANAVGFSPVLRLARFQPGRDERLDLGVCQRAGGPGAK